MQPRVILVEDDTALRESLANWLSKEYIVLPFNSAEAFLQEHPTHWLSGLRRAALPHPAIIWAKLRSWRGW